MIIGREKEMATLQGLLTSDESQFVAVYGRRRVGKTFLIREAYNYDFVFQHTGTYGATRKQQLSDFRDSLLESRTAESCKTYGQYRLLEVTSGIGAMWLHP